MSGRNCGLAAELLPPLPDPGRSREGVDPHKPDTDPPADRESPSAYRSRFPVAWFGTPGWKYYDARKKGVRHWVEGAPYSPPEGMTIQEIRSEIVRERRRKEKERAEQRERERAARGKKKEKTTTGDGEGDKKEGVTDLLRARAVSVWTRAGSADTTQQGAEEDSGQREEEGRKGRAGPGIPEEGEYETFSSVMGVDHSLAQGLGLEQAAWAAAGTERGMPARPMGALAFLFRWRWVRVTAAWLARHPLLVMFGAWVAATLLLLSVEFSTSDTIERAMGGVSTSVGLGLLQNMEILQELLMATQTAYNMVNSLGKLPMALMRLAMFPFGALFFIFGHPNRLRGMATLALTSMGCAALLGLLFDLPAPVPERVKLFGADGRRVRPSTRDLMVVRGMVALYSTIIIAVGGVLLPLILLMALQSHFPLWVGWALSDDLPLARGLSCLAVGAMLGAAVAFVGRFNAEQDLRRDMAAKGGAVAEAAPTLSPSDVGPLKSRRALHHTRFYPFQVKSLGMGLALTMMVLLLVEAVYPMPSAMRRARALMERTSRYR